MKKKEEIKKIKTGTKEKSKEVKKEEKEEKDASVEPETVLEMFAVDHQAAAAVHLDESKLPKWLFKYLVFRFILLDRTGETFTFKTSKDGSTGSMFACKSRDPRSNPSVGGNYVTV